MHLAVLKRKGLLTIRYSTEFADDAELAHAIDEADMLLVLLTAALVNSSEWTGVAMQEAKAARDRHSIPVIPIVVEQCAWTKSWLGQLTAIPVNGKPLSSNASVDEAWFGVIRDLQRVLTSR